MGTFDLQRLLTELATFEKAVVLEQTLHAHVVVAHDQKQRIMRNGHIASITLGLLLFAISSWSKTEENQLYYKEAGTGETILFIHYPYSFGLI